MIKFNIEFVSMIYSVLTVTKGHIIPSFVDFFVYSFAGVAVLSLKG